MFTLFYSLYYAMFVGSWQNFSISEINTVLKPKINALGELITSFFGDNQMTNFGDLVGTNDMLRIISLVLALMTCIGIVVMAVKGIKRVFSVFFMGIR